MRRFFKIRWFLLLILSGFILIFQIPGFAEDKKVSIKERASDIWTTIKVKVALINDKRVKSRYIGVGTSEGVVTLAGAVKSQEERDLVFNITTSIKNISHIRDTLLIQKDLGEACSQNRYSDQFEDVLTTAKIRTLLMVSRIETLKTLSIINVDTCNGVVLLVAKAKSEREKYLATKLAESVTGVVKVIDLISMLPVEV
jgi:osmotically-inducible protein OsmY